MKKIILCSLCIFFAFSQVRSQNVDSLFNSIQGEFQQQFQKFSDKNNEMFDNYVKGIDEDFAKHLSNIWKKYELEKAIKHDSTPEPIVVPKIDPRKKDNNKVDIVVVDTTSIEPIVEETQPQAPNIQKTEEENFETNAVQTSFFGANLSYKYDKNFVTSIGKDVNQKSIAAFWEAMCKTNHYHLVNQLLETKVELNLPDYGYYLLVNDVAKKIASSSENAEKLITWFILSKSRYKIKLGIADNKLFMLLGSLDAIYSKTYYVFGGAKFYVMDANPTSISTYDEDYPDAVLTFDFNINRPLNLPAKIVDKTITFEYNEKKIQVKVKFNKNLIDFYEYYPIGDPRIFFDAAVSNVSKESLVEGLRPLIKGKSELDAANLILSFVQNGFEYKTDPEQFGREKYNFPEETLFYPFCDCDDRAVFFTFLIRELLDLKTVGVGYPGHLSCAINFREDVNGDAFTYRNEKYVISDPTYINAPVGMCMPDFVKVQGTVFESKNSQILQSKKMKIWDKLNLGGCFRGGNGNDVVFDENDNQYVAGFFQNEASIGGMKLKSQNGGKDFFVAKFNKDAQLLWAKQAGNSDEDYACYINVDKNENCYISGSFENKLSIGNKSLKVDKNADVFVAKFDKSGNLLWANRATVDTVPLNHDFVFVSKFSNRGELASTFIFNENQTFENYGIKIDDDGNCYLTDVYANKNGGAQQSNQANYAVNTSYIPQGLKAEKDRLIQANYNQYVAGLFAFMKAVKSNGANVSGDKILEAVNSLNSSLKNSKAELYKSLSTIESLQNAGGIITLRTKNKVDIKISDMLISDNAKFKLSIFKEGTARLTFLSGAKFGSNKLKTDLNTIRILKSGDIIFDYDTEHSKMKLNFKDDIINH